ncbi:MULTISPECIES: transposase [Stenotrophomonas]|uniref:REP-associated tyrosine transposase n=1 Tax=Stenotrophomonas TaxID=40323 RepID=UPI0009E951F5|nr:MULTISPECIES: transposase [Stenotrophomonas]
MSSPKLRLGRVSLPNHIYSITTVTAGRIPLFATPENAEQVIEALRDCELSGISHSVAWVVMPDHLHWLLQLQSGSLGACLQRLKSRSARSIGDAGSIWQAGYHDHAIRHDESLRGVANYLLHNPVRAGLCEQPQDYRYAWCRWGCQL